MWQAFATKHQLALLGVRLTDKPHEQSFIATAPLLLWGTSAGGEFNYEFVAWKPERVIAFVVNKGGIYYSGLLPQAARNVPGILFAGGKDLEFRTHAIVGLFAMNRRAGALWALAEEPNVAHAPGRSRDMALVFFEDVLALRLPEAGTQAITLRSIAELSGFIGDLKARTAQRQNDGPAPTVPTAWLPTARTARAWKALVTDKPFDP